MERVVNPNFPDKEPKLTPRPSSPSSKVESDPEFKDYFKKLQQVFIYITDRCNLGCEQCLYKPLLRQGQEFKFEVATGLLTEFKRMGADKLSILGGEPTTYKRLPDLIKESKSMGYKYVRIDTNGQFDPSFLDDKSMQQINEVTFSLDGNSPEINDALRGKGTYSKCVSNIQKATTLGFNVDITCCVHRGNSGKDEEGNLLIDKMIEFADSIGVKRINLHPLFRMGVPRDNWAGATDISPEDWQNIYGSVIQNIGSQRYSIPVRIPQRFIDAQEFEDNPAYYGYCPVKMGERVLVHPNGQIQICALMIGTPSAIAHYKVEDGIIRIDWNKEPSTSELSKFDLNNPTTCTNQTRDFGNLAPLCISFKPNQREYIWERLDKGWVLKFHKPTQ